MAEYVCEMTDDYPGVPYGSDDYSGTVERRELIVRCRDCAMYDDEDGMCVRDPEHTGRGWYARPDGFCAWGERKEES